MTAFNFTIPKTRSLFILLFLSLFLVIAKASHNRAGEIYYSRIPPYTVTVGGQVAQAYTYSIVVVKYFADGQQIADRCQDSVFFGDGTFGMAPRINGNTCGDCNITVNGIKTTCGEIIVNEGTYRVKKCIYSIIHTYDGPGEYLIHSSDPNRNKGVANILNSDNQAFYIEALLKINSFTGANSSPIFKYAPIDKACQNYCFEHNPGAVDPDGDSLSYEITKSRGTGGGPVFGYTYPEYGSDVDAKYGINPVTGLLSWCSPQAQGEYNIAFIVWEWRKNTSGIYETIGYVLRDMQVIVGTCPKNKPPVINIPVDTCVEAGSLIKRNIRIDDPNIGDVVTVRAEGGSFEYNNPKATVSNTLGTISASGDGFNVEFNWQTTCAHVRNLPYYNTFYATDNGNLKLATFRTYAIRVLPPSVKKVNASPEGVGIRITWDLSTCNPSANPITSYRVYRKNSCTPFVFVPCITHIADTTGFVLIGETSPSGSAFFDDNNGDGLVIGQDYSYMVVAVYKDGTQTYGSTQVCTKLKRNVPVIIAADVLVTSANSGAIQIAWTRPLKTAGNFDTLVYKGPYQFNLKVKKTDGSYETIFNSSRQFFFMLDTSFIHSNINTVEGGKEYYVEFISGTTIIGNSQKANSVFLKTVPSDRRIDLSWEGKTPWNNYSYKVMRKGPSETLFREIGATNRTTYTDSVGVINDSLYCYKITSVGEFSDKLFPKPLINNSQESCAKAKDLTPPCTPTLIIDADCPAGKLKVEWTDVAKICNRSDDVTYYELYFKNNIKDEYIKVSTVKEGETLNYINNDSKALISGCYSIRATDKNGNVGELSPDFCIDNCPDFALPNIFTPNGDGVNEHFKAIRVHQISLIDLVIFDRWGNLVYKTKDPYFKWDGTSMISKQKVSEGTFFYICDVFEPRLTGTAKRTLKGYLAVAE